MAFSKARLYSRKSRIIAIFFRIFSHPTRQEILLKLAKDGSCTVQELSKDHPISGPTMSEHLEQLRSVNFVSYEEKFPHIEYKLELKYILKAKEYMVDYFERLEKLIADKNK